MASGQCACLLEQAFEKVFPVWCYIKGTVHFGLGCNSRQIIILKLNLWEQKEFFYVSAGPSLSLGQSPITVTVHTFHLIRKVPFFLENFEVSFFAEHAAEPWPDGACLIQTTSSAFPAKSECLVTWIVWWPSTHLPVLHHLPLYWTRLGSDKFMRWEAGFPKAKKSLFRKEET